MTRPHLTSTRPTLLARFVLAVALLLLMLPAGAHAHTSLTGSVPGQDTVVEAPPTELVLEFGGDVTATADSFQVFSPAGDRVDAGPPTPSKGARFTQPIEPDGNGTYGVAYRLASEDGHVITGSYSFTVGTASDGGGSALQDAEAAAKVDDSLKTMFSIARFVEIVALFVAAGGGLFVCLFAPTWRPRGILLALAVLLLAYAASFVLNTAIVHGSSVGEALDLDAMGDTAETPFALSVQLRALVAFVAVAPALLLRFGPPPTPAGRVAIAIVFAGLAASMSLTGHAVTTDPIELRLPLDMLHVVAAAIWLGGLVQFALLAPRAMEFVDAIGRFSKVAFAAVVTIFVTGVYATYAELGLDLAELVDSTYGRLIVAKLLLFAGTMPLAFNNMSAFVPRIARRPEDAPRMLRQYVLREAALLLVVVALTVWLIATPQPT
ncbi:MAG: hypothetical protein JWO69_1085 [Thermoleophilia bacterium]|nr:hypothetical protein [Thermoleophilia bacterium]